MKPIRVLGGKVIEGVLTDQKGSALSEYVLVVGILVTLATLLSMGFVGAGYLLAR